MEKFEWTHLKSSPFANTYGSLDLIKNNKNGEYYLVMEDCFADTYYGPLTVSQRVAFNVLCEVPEIEASKIKD